MTIIRVYNGGGASRISIPLLIEMLSNNLDADVRGIGSNEIAESLKWAKSTDVIIFGATSVRGFRSALKTNGLTNLYNAVADIGITYGGICAGAAFAAHDIIYDVIENGEKKKIRSKGLGFFDGYARGPIKAIAGGRPFGDGIDDVHVIEAKRVNGGRNYKAVYWSGPHLIPSETSSLRSTFQITSYLEDPQIPISMVGTCGNGRIATTACHPEIKGGNSSRWVSVKNPNIFQQAKINAMREYLNGEAMDYFIQDLGLSHLQIKRAEGPNLAALL